MLALPLSAAATATRARHLHPWPPDRMLSAFVSFWQLLLLLLLESSECYCCLLQAAAAWQLETTSLQLREAIDDVRATPGARLCNVL